MGTNGLFLLSPKMFNSNNSHSVPAVENAGQPYQRYSSFKTIYISLTKIRLRALHLQGEIIKRGLKQGWKTPGFKNTAQWVKFDFIVFFKFESS